MALLSTQLQPARGDTANSPPEPAVSQGNALFPEHAVQSTYARLKETYASELVSNWTDETEPTKKVYEAISIAAFLIELWKRMYGATGIDYKSAFPGFIDIACGSGILVHVLLSEGYRGRGIDARRRKTWSILPSSTQEQLKEAIYIPKPFAQVLGTMPGDVEAQGDVKFHSELFDRGTFIISSHADELTVWTPLLGALSDPSCPLSFLVIPCCSHGLSGKRYRYPPPKKLSSRSKDKNDMVSKATDNYEQHNHNTQPATGDLKAIRTLKLQQQADPYSLASLYGCLAKKTMRVAKQLGYTVETNRMRIESTRNIAIVGLMGATKASKPERPDLNEHSGGVNRVGAESSRDVEAKIQEIVERECARDGGVEAAAKTWLEGSLGLRLQ